jgi:predicted lipoprotein
MGAIPASEELRNAAGAAQGLAALERMFFGTLMEI